MFRFTTRDLIWLTIVVALGISCLITWAQSRMAIGNLTRSVDEARLDARLWEERAMYLAAHMREAGWKAEVTRTTASLQWPPPEIYEALVIESRKKAGIDSD